MNNLDPARWGQFYSTGVYLYTAHHLTLFGGRRKGSGGKSAGGLTSSKSMGGVSVSYDTGSLSQQNAGQWNATMYGNRYIDLARQIGAGGIQVGAGPFPPISGTGFGGLTGGGIH